MIQMTKNENYSYFLEDNGYWIRNETNFKIIATGLKLGVAQSLVTELNGLYTERQSIAAGFDKYQSHVAETLQKHYDLVNMSLLVGATPRSGKYMGQLTQRACSSLLNEICKDLGIEVKEKKVITPYQPSAEEIKNLENLCRDYNIKFNDIYSIVEDAIEGGEMND